MSDYLRARFPLDNTSTQYMSGKAVYNLVHWNKPGIIAPVELFPADAEAFREAAREAMTEAAAAALRRAADDWSDLDAMEAPEDWLRARAARIAREGGQP